MPKFTWRRTSWSYTFSDPLRGQKLSLGESGSPYGYRDGKAGVGARTGRHRDAVSRQADERNADAR